MQIEIVIWLILFSAVRGWIAPFAKRVVGTALIISFNGLCTPEAMAVSGGGRDFANKDLREGDLKFEGGSFIGKDFTQVLADRVSFKGAKLMGARFYKANLNRADFSNCDLSTASLEDAGLDGTIFDDANLSGAYISSTFERVASIKNADFTDAFLPKKTQAQLCNRADIGGVNTETGANTKESLMCDFL